MRQNILILIGIFLLLEFYIYQAIKTIVSQNWMRYTYISISALIYLAIILLIIGFNRESRSPMRIQWAFSLILIFTLPKILIFLFLFIEDITRILQYLFQKIGNTNSTFPDRRKFISVLGLGIAGLLSLSFIDGITFGKYRHRARLLKLKFKNLPNTFKGYKIVQISDVHAGSFQNPEKLRHAINLINEQNPDLVVFTGDMVNNYAEEFQPFINLFKDIKAKDGKFSVLGNHDYGLYGTFKDENEKAQNIPNLIKFQEQAGFEVLRNESRFIERNDERIYILGVENWGEKPFPQIGDLDKALVNVPTNAVKILLSHDPTHFDYKVKDHPTLINLTLSGHTHGMQFGLDLKNIKWSPVQYRYKKWADLYESSGKYLYVNRGFGVIGYPGRVGINPEITVIELQ